MKKNLLFVAALTASLALSAGEVGKIDPVALGLGADAIAVTAGTVVAQTESVTMSVAFDDNYKSTTIPANDYTAISLDGNEYSDGMQGSTNPKDADGSSPNNSLIAPVGGAAFQLDVVADGFVYILHKASSHKGYTCFENGSAIGYEFVMNTTNDLLGPVYKWTLEGEGEFNYIPAGDTIRWPEQYAEGYADWLTANSAEKIGAGGMGYIKFPVFKDCTYLVNANGSKLTSSGFYYISAGEAQVELVGETNLVLAEASAGTVDPGVGVKQISSNATVVKTEYYTISGVKSNGPTKGVNIIKNIMSDGSIKTSKGVFLK